MSSERQDRIYLRRHHRDGAMGTADIAHGLQEKTPKVRAALLRLEPGGPARGRGQPDLLGLGSGWALTAPAA